MRDPLHVTLGVKDGGSLTVGGGRVRLEAPRWFAEPIVVRTAEVAVATVAGASSVPRHHTVHDLVPAWWQDGTVTVVLAPPVEVVFRAWPATSSASNLRVLGPSVGAPDQPLSVAALRLPVEDPPATVTALAAAGLGAWDVPPVRAARDAGSVPHLATGEVEVATRSPRVAIPLVEAIRSWRRRR